MPYNNWKTFLYNVHTHDSEASAVLFIDIVEEYGVLYPSILQLPPICQLSLTKTSVFD